MSRSYLFTLTFFILHQMDAAYWHEWDMFYNFPPEAFRVICFTTSY